VILLIARVIAALAAGLPLQYNLADLDAFVEGFARIVNGQRSNAGRYQRFHFDSVSAAVFTMEEIAIPFSHWRKFTSMRQ
jgi:hypothetical protein